MVAEKTVELNVAAEFTPTPGPRFRIEGDFSGEEFRETILSQKFASARSQGAILHVDLDGGYGYAPSFLEEAFGGLVRELGKDVVMHGLTFKSDEEPYLLQDIRGYIQKAGS